MLFPHRRVDNSYFPVRFQVRRAWRGARVSGFSKSSRRVIGGRFQPALDIGRERVLDLGMLHFNSDRRLAAPPYVLDLFVVTENPPEPGRPPRRHYQHLLQPYV